MIFYLLFFFYFEFYYFYKYKISVIIPIYKAEKYLNDCLDSLVNQTLTDIQIICINDESPDNSINILKEYAKNDKRIIIKNIKHVSISETRNEGLKYVEGEYTGFMDDDDIIDLNQFEKMYEYSKNDDIDLLEFGFQKIKENQKFKNLIINKVEFKDEKVINNVDGNIFKVLRNENWNKIYKTKIIEDYNIKFTPDLGGEDLNFNLKYYPFVKKFKKIFSKTYYWRRKKKGLYNPIKYYFGRNKLFFESLVEYYQINKININNPILCFELMIIGYKRLFQNKKKFIFKAEYLTNFFNIIKKLNLKEEEIINKIPYDLKKFYIKIYKKYRNLKPKKKKKKKRKKKKKNL